MHLLLVEDNLMNQKLMIKILSKFGYTCDVANNGQEALDMFSPQKYALTLMDIQMPIMDGITAAKEILKEHPVYPIIALTANITEENKTACLEAGMIEFLTKPIDKNLLHEILQSYDPETT